MTTKTTIRIPLLLVLSAALSTSCVEKVDDGSTSRAVGWDGISTDHLEPGDREIFTTIAEDPNETVATGCDKTEMDAMAILDKNCAKCHNIGAASSGTSPVFSFVLDKDKLVNTLWHRSNSMDLRFVKPGDADSSQIWVRAALLQDMPPNVDFGANPLPKITFSDGSVLRAWIETCLGADPLAGTAGTGGASAGGAGGMGGGTGTGGTAGTGGAAGAAGTSGTNPDGGTTLAACAAGVASGNACNFGAQDCSLPDATACTCMRVGGGRQWACT